MSDDHDDLFGDLENLDADSPVKTIEHIKSEEKPKTIKRNREDDDDDDGDEEVENDAKKICLESENKELDLFQYNPKEQERIKMQVLVSNFSEEQLNRYELFRRATFTKASIRRLMNSVTSAVINQNVLIAMSGIAKVFVGEMVESALDVMEQWEESGPIQPKHLREAHRRMRAKKMCPSTKIKNNSFLM